MLNPSLPLTAMHSPTILIPIRILHKARHNLTPRLQQRMTRHDPQKLLQPLPPMLNHIIAESVREDLARQGRDGDARGFPL